MANLKKTLRKDDGFDYQALGDKIPPQYYHPKDAKEGLNVLWVRCKTLGLPPTVFIASFINTSTSTFYRNVNRCTLRYQHILTVGMILRLNPADYMFYDPGLNKSTISSRIQRARIKRPDSILDKMIGDKKLDDLFNW